MIFPILLLLQGSFALLTAFKPGETIEWVVDLQERYPRGILCRELKVQLQDGLEISTRNQNLLGFDFPIQIEVGNRYKFTWSLNDVEEIIPSDTVLELQLICKQDRGIDEILAQSEKFIFKSGWDAESELDGVESIHRGFDATLTDISPKSFYLDYEFNCPITFSRMQIPVYNQISDSCRHVFEARALHQYLQNSNGLKCPVGNPIRDIGIDHQMLAKYAKFPNLDESITNQNDIWNSIECQANSKNLKVSVIHRVTFTMKAGKRTMIIPKMFRTITSHLIDSLKESFLNGPILEQKKLVIIIGHLARYIYLCSVRRLDIFTYFYMRLKLINLVLVPLRLIGMGWLPQLYLPESGDDIDTSIIKARNFVIILVILNTILIRLWLTLVNFTKRTITSFSSRARVLKSLDDIIDGPELKFK